VAKGELDTLDARTVVNEPGSEVMAETVQADAFGKTRNLSGRHPDVCPARTVQRTALSGSENQIGGTDVMLSLIRVGAVPDLDFNRRVEPGVVPPNYWRPGPGGPDPAREISSYAAVGRKR
jgi:hypothetical protein